MPKIKVLHIITRLDRGGSAANTLLTVIGLDKNRYEVTLASGISKEPMARLMNKAQAAGAKHVIIKELVREISPWKDLCAFFAIYRLIKNGKYDIVHTHSSKAGIISRWAAYIARVPRLVHTPHGHVFYGYFNKVYTKLFIFLEQVTARFSDKIVGLTNQEVKEHLMLNIGRAEKFAVIHSGVEFDDLKPSESSSPELKAELNIPPASPVVGSLGRLEEVKGYKYLIEAIPHILKQLPEVYFLLAGDGKLRKALQQQCVALGVEQRLVFCGWRDDVCRIMSAMDIFVLSSLNEGMGKVLVEAMALKKPIVSTSVGGVPELIKDGQNGLLIPPGDSVALADAVVKLLKDKAKAQEMGASANRGIDQYSARHMLSKIEALYEELLGEAP